jgi:hypothetical protein
LPGLSNPEKWRFVQAPVMGVLPKWFARKYFVQISGNKKIIYGKLINAFTN